jgi:hypothetical protein
MSDDSNNHRKPTLGDEMRMWAYGLSDQEIADEVAEHPVRDGLFFFGGGPIPYGEMKWAIENGRFSLVLDDTATRCLYTAVARRVGENEVFASDGLVLVSEAVNAFVDSIFQEPNPVQQVAEAICHVPVETLAEMLLNLDINTRMSLIARVRAGK